MDSVRVKKLDLTGLKYCITLPASKSMANRAFILAAQTIGEYEIKGNFEAEDIQLMISALRQLGLTIKEREDGVKIINNGSWVENENDIELFLGNSGTSIRFLSSLMCLRYGKTILTGVKRMKEERPISALVDALRIMGVEVSYLEKKGYPPIQIEVKHEPFSKVSVRGNASSQYVTSLMLIGSSLENGLEITLDGPLISKPYVEITQHMIEEWGGEVMFEGGIVGVEPADLECDEYDVEGDASGAVYWWGLDYLHGSEVEIMNLSEGSVQGDVGFLELVNSIQTDPRLFMKGNNIIEIDMNDMPDASLMLMAMAPLMEYPVRIVNIGSLRVKETDRIAAMATELKKIGVLVETGEDWMQIDPLDMEKYNDQQVIQIDTYVDHRIAMSFAVLGTKLGNLEILDPECVGKTYPRFWEELERRRMNDDPNPTL